MSAMGPPPPGKNDGLIPSGVPSPESSKEVQEGKTSEVFQGALKRNSPPHEEMSTSALLAERNRLVVGGKRICLAKIEIAEKPFVSKNREQSLAFEKDVQGGLGVGGVFMNPRSPPKGASPWFLNICRFFCELPEPREGCSASGQLSKEDFTDLPASHGLPEEPAELKISGSVSGEFTVELIGLQNEADLEKLSNLVPDPDSIARDITPVKEESRPVLIPIRSGELAGEGIRQGVTNTFIARSSAGNLAVIKPALGVFRYGLSSDWHKLHPHREGIQYSDMVGRERLAFVISNLLGKIWGEMSVSIPETQLIQIPAKFFVGRFVDALLPEDMLVCSVQQFIPSTNLALCPNETVSDMDPKKLRAFAVLDILIYNADRGKYNAILSTESGDLVPIDHGLILSRGFQALPDFFWIGLDGCNTPFLPEEIAVISHLKWEVIRDEVLVAMPGIDSETLNTLNTTLEFLKISVELGLNPYQMAILFCKIKDIDTVFVRHCYEEAKALPGEFSKNIQLVIRKYLVPCASFITDPDNASFLVMQNEGAYGYKIPLMCVMLESLDEIIKVSSTKEERLDRDMPFEELFMQILQDRVVALKTRFNV